MQPSACWPVWSIMVEPTVLFIATGLGAGGAEQALIRLLRGLGNGPVRPALAALRSGGSLATEAAGLDLPFMELDMEQGGAERAAGMIRLVRFARAVRPDILQGWMYHGNAAASLTGLAMPGSRVFWSIRQSLEAPETEQTGTSRLIHRAVHLRRRPERIVYNSSAAALQHEELGYPEHCRQVIPNGFNTERFRPDPEARNRIRDELGLPRDTILIGMVARYHPVKDHDGFLRAAALLARLQPGVHFLLAGAGACDDNRELLDQVHSRDLAGRCHLLGERDDIPAVTAALDVATLTSLSEGFPNVIGEAMACGVPVAATSAGETPEILAGIGTVVPCGDPEGMAASWSELLDMPEEARRTLGDAGRARIQDRYGLTRMISSFEKLYQSPESGG
jgi:glycosyltransferase involved in cell wall biosynthesis